MHLAFCNFVQRSKYWFAQACLAGEGWGWQASPKNLTGGEGWFLPNIENFKSLSVQNMFYGHVKYCVTVTQISKCFNSRRSLLDYKSLRFSEKREKRHKIIKKIKMAAIRAQMSHTCEPMVCRGFVRVLLLVVRELRVLY